jgi:hypothetical protein
MLRPNQGLEFFQEHPAEGDDCAAFLFKAAEIDRIDSAISDMLAQAAGQADVFAKTLDCGFDADDVIDSLHRAEVSLDLKSDHAEDLNLLFGYLKSYQWLCRASLEKGWAVVHVQWF